jgi:Uma2 family endonuclease
MVVPEYYGDALRNQPDRLAIFDRTSPFVAEVWSVSTGGYDVKAKLPVYMQRGDAEIWLIHPYEKTVTCWPRRPDGTYHASEHGAGVIELAALSGVVINVAELFA